jgi:hypothetical protein
MPNKPKKHPKKKSNSDSVDFTGAPAGVSDLIELYEKVEEVYKAASTEAWQPQTGYSNSANLQPAS